MSNLKERSGEAVVLVMKYSGNRELRMRYCSRGGGKMEVVENDGSRRHEFTAAVQEYLQYNFVFLFND